VPGVTGLTLSMTAIDTTVPALIFVSAINRNQVKVKFNVIPSESTAVDTAGYRIVSGDSAAPETLGLREIYADISDDRTFHLITDDQVLNRRYTLNILDIYSQSKIRCSDTIGNSKSFNGTNVLDTTAVALQGSVPSKNQSNVSPRDSILLTFTKPVNFKSLESGISLRDTLDSAVVCSLGRIDPVRAKITFSGPLKDSMTYRLYLEPAKVIDLNGYCAADSEIVIPFSTWSKNSLGSIQGRLEFSHYSEGPVQVEVADLRTKRTYKSRIEKRGEYTVEMIPDGNYFLHAYVDRNQNARLDLGCLSPFEFSEPQYIITDTITVRRRWPTKNIDITF
jgi:hypothetical protein